jgi:hypothetical protein
MQLFFEVFYSFYYPPDNLLKIVNIIKYLINCPPKWWINNKVYNSVELLTKKQSLENYYIEISKNEIASIVKLCDRICNVKESINNRNYHKLKKYINESKKFKIIYSKSNKLLSNKLEILYLKGKLISIFHTLLY